MIMMELIIDLKIISLIIVVLFTIGCKEQSENSDFACGRMLFKKMAYGSQGSYTFISNNKSVEIKTTEKNQRISNLKLMNHSSSMIGTLCPNVNYNSSVCNLIVEFDINGNAKDALFVLTDDVSISSLHVSNSDILATFITSNVSKDIAKNLAGEREASLYVVNLTNGELIKQLVNLGDENLILMDENPWDQNDERLVFTVASNSKRIQVNQEESTLDKGVYVYHILKDSVAQIDKSGSYASWSNDGRYIAYLKENKLCLFDDYSNEVKVIYDPEKKIKINNIHWNPCQKEEILIFEWNSTGVLMGDGYPSQKLINVRTKQQQEVKTPLYETYFSWKPDVKTDEK